MKTIKEVIRNWEENSHVSQTMKMVPVNLSLRDVAKIQALSELFPGFTEEQFITELISAALDEVEGALPYVKGDRIVGEDEFGEAVYEDIGKTPRFEQLTNQYAATLEKKFKTEK